MRRLSVLITLMFALPACVEDGTNPPPALGTIDQHGTNTAPITPTDYRRGERLFARTATNPYLVVTPGDRAGTLLAWGTEGGSSVRWIKRLAVAQYRDVMAQIASEFVELENPTQDHFHGGAGFFQWMPPPPPPPPHGYPATVLNQVADYAGAQLALAQSFNTTFTP